jgi:hypothetical protein
VENLVGYAKRDLVVPADPAVEDLTAANAEAARWCAEVNGVVHSEIVAVPAERGGDRTRTAQGVAVVAAGRDRCQAGQPQGRQALVRAVRLSPLLGPEPAHRHDRAAGRHRHQVQVMEPFTGEVLAEHAIVAPGEDSIVDEHYGSSRPDKPRRAPRAKTATEKRFLVLGEVAEQFLMGATAAGVSKLATELEQILVLHAAHGEAALLTALARG